MTASDFVLLRRGSASASQTLGPFTTRGSAILDRTGAPFFGAGVTWFPGLEMAITHPDDALRVLDGYAALGVGGIRTTGRFTDPGGIGKLVGRHFAHEQHPQWQSRLAWLLERARERSMFVLHPVLVNCQWAPTLNQAQQQQYLDETSDVLNDYPEVAIAQLANEAGFNGVDPFQFNRPTGAVLWSRGSRGTGYQPYHPEWDLFDFEGEREDDFERKYKSFLDQRYGDNPDGVGGPTYAFRGAGIISEMIGLGDNYESGKTTNDPFKVWQFTLGAKMMGCSLIILHSRSGIAGRLPVAGGLEEQCIRAGLAAAQIPFGQFRDGHYVRGNAPYEIPSGDLPVVHHDCVDTFGPDGRFYPGHPDGSLRTHAMLSADKQSAECLAPHPVGEYPFAPMPGWTPGQLEQFPGCPVNAGRLTR